MRHVALAVLSASALLSGCQNCSGGSGGQPQPADATAAQPAVLDAGSSFVRPEGGTLNVTPVPTASVAAMVNPDRLPEYICPDIRRPNDEKEPGGKEQPMLGQRAHRPEPANGKPHIDKAEREPRSPRRRTKTHFRH